MRVLYSLTKAKTYQMEKGKKKHPFFINVFVEQIKATYKLPWV